MPTAADSSYAASSPPFIFDSDMSGQLDSDPDFDFFDSTLPTQAANSPDIFSSIDFATDNSQYLVGFGSPRTDNRKSPALNQSSVLDTRLQQSLSAPSTLSPAGSYGDSSSDSSVGYKRKSSSDSSRSAQTSDAMMADDTDMVDWKVEDMISGDARNFASFNGTMDPAAMSNGFEIFSDKTMENDFDFESAASSPSPFGGNGQMDSPEMPVIKHDTPRNYSPMMKTKSKHRSKAPSVGFSDMTLTKANRI